jgi:predicted dehydrogenase
LRDEENLVAEIGVCDPFTKDAQTEIAGAGANWIDSIENLPDFEPELVIVATPHDTAVGLVESLLPTGTRVLMEKPFGRTLAEAERLASLMRYEDQITLGCNYRFFPGVSALLRDANSGLFGQLVSINMVLAHGGSPGMEKGWKFDPVKAGGGCLIDPGIHLLDLCHVLSRSGVQAHSGRQWRGFWNTGIEEEVHLHLEGANNMLINMQVSIVRWRSKFEIEINGVDGYGVVEGRGRSYGPQSYRRGQRWGWRDAKDQKSSEEEVCVSDCQESFRDELRAVLLPPKCTDMLHPCSAKEALNAMRTYEECLRIL